MKRLKKVALDAEKISICVERTDTKDSIWIDLPTENDIEEEIKEKFGIDEDDEIEFDVIDAKGIPFKAIKGENFYDINDYVDEYERLSEYEQEVVDALLDNLYDFDEALKKYEECLVIDGTTDEDLGYYYAEQIDGGVSNLSKDTLEQYFNYEAYGRDIRLNGDFIEYDGKLIETFLYI